MKMAAFSSSLLPIPPCIRPRLCSETRRTGAYPGDLTLEKVRAVRRSAKERAS